MSLKRNFFGTWQVAGRNEDKEMGEGTLFVISAPSGAGKSTLVAKIRQMFPDMLYSVSCTSRPPRNGEREGVDYYFVDPDEFRAMIRRGEFLEWKEVHGNLYGTPAGPVNSALAAEQRIILDIDVEGAKEVFKRIPQAVGVFISAPDMSTLKQRLVQRGTDSKESVKIRLANAAHEMKQAGMFRHQIVNDDLEEAVKELAGIIRKESE
ncbi:MAG: guanylate kinase [Desulfomonilaceae bacterium]